LLIKITGHESPEKGIVLDGEYTPGGAIAAAVANFQQGCDLPVTGDFDAETRARFEREFGIDLGVLAADMFSAPTAAVGPTQDPGVDISIHPATAAGI